MDEATKTCSYCEEEKPLSDFYRRTNRPSGHQSRCKSCHRLENDSHARRWKLETYGLSADEYCELLTVQQGVCAICGRPPEMKRLAVDHDHLTKEIRGLLCTQCNVGLGMFSDDIDRLTAAISYLKSFG